MAEFDSSNEPEPLRTQLSSSCSACCLLVTTMTTPAPLTIVRTVRMPRHGNDSKRLSNFRISWVTTTNLQGGTTELKVFTSVKFQMKLGEVLHGRQGDDPSTNEFGRAGCGNEFDRFLFGDQVTLCLFVEVCHGDIFCNLLRRRQDPWLVHP